MAVAEVIKLSRAGLYARDEELRSPRSVELAIPLEGVFLGPW